MIDISLYKIVKLFTYIFLSYILLFKYIIGEHSLILYGSVFAALSLMFADISLSHLDILSICPYGVLSNFIMCIYSLIVGFVVAQDRLILLSYVKTYFAFFLVCVIICYITVLENNIEWLTDYLLIIYFLCFVYIVTRGYYIEGYGKVLSLENNPNSLGVNMDIGIFCAAYSSKNRTKYFPLYFSLALLFIFIIVGCGSRKCLIAACLIFILWLGPLFVEKWINGNRSDRILVLFTVFIIISFIYIYLFNYYKMTDSYIRMTSLVDPDKVKSGERILLYKYAIDCFVQRPLLGIGLAQFMLWNPLHEYAHSIYAEALADWGLIGCIIYFSPILVATWKLFLKIFEEYYKRSVRVVFALLVMELFLGFGQVWFYDFEHLLIWTVIFLFLDKESQSYVFMKRGTKYVKA